jgi:hypothetical protein
MQKLLIVIFLLFIFNKNKTNIQCVDYTPQETSYMEMCNIQIPGKREDCNDLKLDDITRSVSGEFNVTKRRSCCFERFRINKIVTTRCIYLENTEYAISNEKKYLQKEWGVKNLTILCDSGFLKYNLLMILILAGFIL